MYLLAFSGLTSSSPIFYSFDSEVWYYPDGKIYKTYQMNDDYPAPGKDYRLASVPTDDYTFVRIYGDENPVLISQSGKVEIRISDSSIMGKGYYTDFFLLCPIPDTILNNKMIFRNKMNLPYRIPLPEFPFIHPISHKVSGTDDVKYDSQYQIEGHKIFLACDNNEKDYFLKIKEKCIPCNDQLLNQNFHYADGYYKNLVVKYQHSVEVYPLKWYPFITFGGHYQLETLSPKWKEYYQRRLHV